jgi:indolepyruvate decarboxylase
LANSERVRIRHHEYSNVEFVSFVQELCQSPDLLHRDPSWIVPMQPRVQPCDGLLTMSGVLYELNAFIDDETLMVTDVGDPMFAATDIKTHEGTSFLCPAYYASMGFAIPGAVGAALGDPFRRVVVLVGDGAFLMTGMELLTIKRLGLNPIILVLNNRGYTSLRTMGHQQATYLHQFPEVDFAQLATTFGGVGFVVETAEQLRLALAKAKELPTFSVLDIRLRPDDVSPALQRLGDLFAQRLKG